MGYEGGEIASIVRPHLAREAAHRMAERGGERMTELVRENTPISPMQSPLEARVRLRKRRRGTLRASWYTKPIVAVGDRLETGTATEDPIAPYVEWSTRPHEIRPNPPNRRLAFVKDGRWWFPRVVHHPGTTGQAMMRIGAAKLEHEVEHGLLQRDLEWWKRQMESRP